MEFAECCRTMLSAGAVQLLERVRSRFGCEVEVLDGRLNSVYDTGAARCSELLRASPELADDVADLVRRRGLQPLELPHECFRIAPLRDADPEESGAAIVAVRQASGSPEERTLCSELVQEIVEADVAMARRIEEERDIARRTTGCLRFVRHLCSVESTSRLLEEVVQAFAIWFDADARVYRRGFDSTYELVACLPGVRSVEPARRLSESEALAGCENTRDSAQGAAGASNSPDVITLRLGPQSDDNDWMLHVCGRFSASAELAISTVVNAAGLQVARIEQARADALRARFERLLAESPVAERAASVFLRELLREMGGSSGALTLRDSRGSRRLALIAGDPALVPPSSAADHFVVNRLEIHYPLALGNDLRATLDLHASADAPFGRDALLAFRTCLPVLRAWLAAAAPPLLASELFDVPRESAIERRIAEEMARATRFGLGLALLLVDVGGAAGASRVEDALRGELRGSDVLGVVKERHVVALLTHTDAAGVERVAARLRARLAAAAEQLKVSDLKVGKAALSASCRTPEALLAQALSLSEPLIRH